MYLLTCFVVLIPVMFTSLKGMLNVAMKGQAPDPRYHPFKTFLPALLANLMLSPLLAALFDEWRLHSGQAIAASTGAASVMLALIGAAGILVLTVRDGFRNRHGLGFWGTGKCLALTVAASIGVVATTSHLLFTHGEHAGTVAFDAFRDAAPDIQCDASVLLIRWSGEQDSPVQYRCPTTYLLNRHASRPFLPWPDYREGYSADLAVVLHEMLKNAQKP